MNFFYSNIQFNKENSFFIHILDTNFKNGSIRYNGKRFQYDQYGNPIIYKNLFMEWSRGNLLTEISGIIPSISFTYDGQKRRIRKQTINDSIEYHYIGNRLIQEYRNNHILSYIYANEELIGFVLDNSFYLYNKNIFNDIIGILDSDGNTVASYIYDAWGNQKVIDSSGIENNDSEFIGNLNPYRYRSYYYDVETGLFMMGHRYYDPEIGRFISPDDVEYLDPTKINGLNLYAYCNNDPVNYLDPDGHLAISAIIIGALIGFTTAYLLDVFSNFSDGVEWSDFNTFEDNWLKYIGATIGGAVGGLGSGLLSTILTSGLGNVIESSFAGNIGSFSDILLEFSIGAVIGGFGYGISKGVTSYFADKKIFSLLGNLSDNTKVNKRLANLGYKNLKIGRDGFGKIYQALYKDYGFSALNKVISYSYDFVTGLLF